MPKTYKQFVKEYAMGLQVPSMSYMKPTGSLTPLRKKENRVVADVIPQGELKPLRKKNEISLKLKGKVLDRKIKRAKDKFYSKKFLKRKQALIKNQMMMMTIRLHQVMKKQKQKNLLLLKSLNKCMVKNF